MRQKRMRRQCAVLAAGHHADERPSVTLAARTANDRWRYDTYRQWQPVACRAAASAPRAGRSAQARTSTTAHLAPLGALVDRDGDAGKRRRIEARASWALRPVRDLATAGRCLHIPSSTTLSSRRRPLEIQKGSLVAVGSIIIIAKAGSGVGLTTASWLMQGCRMAIGIIIVNLLQPARTPPATSTAAAAQWGCGDGCCCCCWCCCCDTRAADSSSAPASRAWPAGLGLGTFSSSSASASRASASAGLRGSRRG